MSNSKTVAIPDYARDYTCICFLRKRIEKGDKVLYLAKVAVANKSEEYNNVYDVWIDEELYDSLPLFIPFSCKAYFNYKTGKSRIYAVA